jgi:hypothetical protein
MVGFFYALYLQLLAREMQLYLELSPVHVNSQSHGTRNSLIYKGCPCELTFTVPGKSPGNLRANAAFTWRNNP